VPVEYTNLIRDFAERTLKNLELIEDAVKKNPQAELFEVTQLINSMRGLLVFPKERFYDSIPRTPAAELRSQGWPIPVMKGSPPRAEDLRDLVRCLRNGISHCNVEFLSDGHNLTGLRIWNERNGAKEWEAQLDLLELRQIARKFVSLLLESNR
jgi:hypothetical protein